MRKIIIITALCTIPTAQAFGQGIEVDVGAACKSQEDALAGVAAEFAADQERIEHESREIEDEAPQGPRISGEIVFEDAHVGLHLPSVTMTDATFAFDTPQLTMKQKGFKWKVPEVVMVDKVVARVPVLRCTWLRCRTEMKDIITAVPETRWKLKEASTDVPEIRMARTQLITAIPRVEMRRQDLYYKLPRITVDDIIPDYGPTESRSKHLKHEADQLAAAMTARSAELTDGLFDCYRSNLVTQRSRLVTEFEHGIGELTKAINVVRAMDADPAAFQPSDAPDGQTINLLAQREDLIEKRDAALAKIDAAIAQLTTQTTEDIEALSTII